jgi:hypothetical protein
MWDRPHASERTATLPHLTSPHFTAQADAHACKVMRGNQGTMLINRIERLRGWARPIRVLDLVCCDSGARQERHPTPFISDVHWLLVDRTERQMVDYLPESACCFCLLVETKALAAIGGATTCREPRTI